LVVGAAGFTSAGVVSTAVGAAGVAGVAGFVSSFINFLSLDYLIFGKAVFNDNDYGKEKISLRLLSISPNSNPVYSLKACIATLRPYLSLK